MQKVSHHVDDYYDRGSNSFLTKKYPFEWLTIRKRDGKILLNYKHWYPENVKYTTHCDEYELEVGDAKMLSKLLGALGSKKFITIDKEREVYNYKSTFEIALDKVKGLGYFMEVESLKDFGSPDKTHAEILNFTKSLGIKETKTVPGGYAAEMMRKKSLVR